MSDNALQRAVSGFGSPHEPPGFSTRRTRVYDGGRCTCTMWTLLVSSVRKPFIRAFLILHFSGGAGPARVSLIV